MTNRIDLPETSPSQAREAPSIGKDQFSRKKLLGLLHLITADLKTRGNKTPHVYLPFRSRVDDAKLDQFLGRVFPGGVMIDLSNEAVTRSLLTEFDEFTLTCALKFLWCRLPNNEIIGWDEYQEFKRKEQEAGYPKDAFLAIMPKCLLSAAHASIVYDFLDLLINLAANSQKNHLNGEKITKMASIWAFSCTPKSNSGFYDATMIREVSFLDGLQACEQRSNGLYHLLLSFLRAMLPDKKAETLKLPKTLQSLLIASTYPPPEDENTVKSAITIPCVHVRSTRKSADPYELLSKIRHTLRFDQKDAFLSIENYTILKSILQKDSTSEIISNLTEESRRCLQRLTAKPGVSHHDIYSGWARLSLGINSDIPLFSEVTILNVTLRDYYIWTWLSSLASDQSTSMKALFGRSIVVEAGLCGFKKWIIITETTILPDEYVSMFKNNPAPEDKTLPPLPVIEKMTKPDNIPIEEEPLPLLPVEKDSILIDITNAIDSFAFEDQVLVSENQLNLNKLAEPEREISPQVPPKPFPQTTAKRERPRPSPPEKTLSPKADRAKMTSPKRAPKPIEENGQRDCPEVQAHKMDADKSLPQEPSVLGPINGHKKGSDNNPSRHVKPSESYEVPPRHTQLVVKQEMTRPEEGTQIEMPEHFQNTQPSPARIAESLEPKRQIEKPQDQSMYPSRTDEHVDINEPRTQAYFESVPPVQERARKIPAPEEHERKKLSATPSNECREPPMEEAGRALQEQESVDSPAPYHNHYHERQSPAYQNHGVYEPSVDINTERSASPAKKKKKKKRKSRNKDFSMPDFLPDGPPPPFPPVDFSGPQHNGFEPRSQPQFDQTQVENGERGHGVEQRYEDRNDEFHVHRELVVPNQGGCYSSHDVYAKEPEELSPNKTRIDRVQRHSNGNEPAAKPVQTRNQPYQESRPMYSGASITRSSHDFGPELQARQHDPPHNPHEFKQPLHNSHEYKQPHHSYEYEQWGQMAQPSAQKPPKQTLPPQSHHLPMQAQPEPQTEHFEQSPLQSQAPETQPQTPSQRTQPYVIPQLTLQQFLRRQYLLLQQYQPQFQQQFQQTQYPTTRWPSNAPTQLYPPAMGPPNCNPAMQWPQPQYGMPPQAYGPPPMHGFPMPQPMYYPPPQGYYPPPQGYYPPPQHVGKPKAKPTTSELAILTMPMAVGFKKNSNPNKAGMRAAFNQGSFGI